MEKEGASRMPNTKAVKISEETYNFAKWTAEAEQRTISGQIEYWARIGRVAIDNPDLPIEFIRDILISKAQGRALAEPFMPE
jgi:hypothetical protein